MLEKSALGIKNMKNVGLITYSTSEYFRQHWIEILRDKVNNFSHFVLNENLTRLQKEKAILAFIDNNKLDLLIITIGYQLFNPSFYKKLPVRKLFYFTDDDWTFNMRTRFMCQYASIVTTQSECQLDNYKRFNKNVFCMTWAANPYLFKKSNCEKKYDVTFIGGPHSNRYEVLRFLKDNSVNLRIFGGGWNNYPDMKDIWGGYLSTQDLVKTINESKINLNFLTASIGNVYEMKARLFEIPCTGGFQLCDNWEEVYKFYEKDKEISTFSSKEDLLEKINYYLCNEQEREEITRKAHLRTMKEHTWDIRFDKLFEEIAQMDWEHYKAPGPYISDKRVAVLYSPKNDKIERNVIGSINAQTLPNVTLYVLSDFEIANLTKIRYPCKIISRRDIKEVKLHTDYLSYIEDGDQWEPEKLQFQAFALEEDEKEGIYTSFAGWGIYRSNQRDEFATYFLRWLRDYAGENRLVKDCIFPSCLMFNLGKFAKNEQSLLIDYAVKNNSTLIEKIFLDKKSYKFIDIEVSSVRIAEKRFWNLLKRLNFADAAKFLRTSMKLDIKKYLINLVLRFKMTKICFLLRIFLRKKR